MAEIESLKETTGPMLPQEGIDNPKQSFRMSKEALRQNMDTASQASLINDPFAQSEGRPITTSIFEFFKVGPGPSSSHTTGPMKAAFDFLSDVRKAYQDSELNLEDKYKLEIHLHGSLSLTGKGHGTDRAIIGGLLGWLPPTCDPEVLNHLLEDPLHRYRVPVAESLSRTSSDVDVSSPAVASPASVMTAATVDTPLGSALQAVKDIGEAFCGPYYPLEFISVGSESIIWHEAKDAIEAGFPHPNTVIFRIVNEDEEICLEREYYSVGGGFIQKKGCPAEDHKTTKPKYPYQSYDEVKVHLKNNPGLTIPELVIQNEIALTGRTREEVYDGVRNVIKVMEAAVVRGLNSEGELPGPMKVVRKAGKVFRKAQGQTNVLLFLNSYCLAASEENAAGHMVVTAPTNGSAGVYPGLLHFMKQHLCYNDDQVVEAFLASCVVGFIIKTNSSISGAEMGCMGETGTASSMGAFMLAYAAQMPLHQIEAAAEIAMEHMLGLTCDPIGGYVLIPCIERNPMAAVKAYNATLLAMGCDEQKISFDKIVEVMKATGEDMDSKYKETSLGGLAVAYQMEC